jgi:hypothetical protein
MRRLPSHLTYANVMVTLLAFIVLGGGTALGAFIINSNSEVGPDTISGHNPPAGANPNLIADSVNQTDLAPDAETCRTPGTLSMTTSDPGQLVCRSGSLRLRARCRAALFSASQPGTFGQIRIRSGVDHAFATPLRNNFADEGQIVDFGPSDGFVTLFEHPALSQASAQPFSTSFIAGSPDGSQLAGNVGFRATQLAPDGTGTCDFVIGASE